MGAYFVTAAVLAFAVVARAGTAWAHRRQVRLPQPPSGAPSVRTVPAESICHVMRHAGSGVTVPHLGSPLAARILRLVLSGHLRAERVHMTGDDLLAEFPPDRRTDPQTQRVVGWVSRLIGPVEYLQLTRAPQPTGDDPTAGVFAAGATTRRIANREGDDDLRSAGKALEAGIEVEARRWGVWFDRPVGRAALKTFGTGLLLAIVLAIVARVLGHDWHPLFVTAGGLLGAAAAAFRIREPQPRALVEFSRSADAELGMRLDRAHRLVTIPPDQPGDPTDAELADRSARELLEAVSLLYAMHPNMGSPEWGSPTEWLNAAARRDPYLHAILRTSGWDPEDFPDTIDWIYFITSRVRKGQEMDSD